MVSSLISDLRYAARLLANSPTFTVVAVATLALGIGANTAIFSVVDAALLNPLPYPDAGRLVLVSETVQRGSLERRPLSYPDFRDLRDRASSFDGIAAWTDEVFTLALPDAPARQVTGELVSSGYFDLLGGQAVSGRTFSTAEADEREKAAVAVVSARFAEKYLASNAVGRVIRLNDRSFTVIGVTAAGFTGLSDAAEVWIPFGMMATSEPARMFEQRGGRWHSAVARLKPGVSLAQANADAATVGRQLEQSHQDTNSHYGMAVYDLRDETVGEIQPLLLTLLGSVGFVLLIACVNLANLLLARASTRQRETAIRAALGASRRRLARQFLVEGLLLSVIGALAGMLLAMWSADAIAALSPAGLPSFVKPHLSGHVIAFVAGAATLCGALLGLLPAIHGARTDLNDVLKESTRGSSGGPSRARVRAVLVIAEVALSLLLLAGAGLMVRSFVNLQHIDVGFRADRTLTLRTAVPQKYESARLVPTVDALLARLHTVSGVQAVALGTDAPFAGGSSAIIVTPEASEARAAEGVRVYRHSITPGFFDALGTALTTGRDFSTDDAAASQAVVIVSKAFAAKAWPGADPVGRRIAIGRGASKDWITVVGIVPDFRYRSLRLGAGDPPDPDVYFPYAQQPGRGLTVVARTALTPSAMVSPLRDAVQQFDRDLPVWGERAVSAAIAERTASFRLGAGVMSFFGAVAVLLAGIGVFGLINYSVAQRQRELGVRTALGASRGEIYRLVLRDAAFLTGLGVAGGLIAAFPAARLISSQLYGVTPADPLTYVIIVGLLGLVSLAAALLPARRAARIDPMVALRAE